MKSHKRVLEDKLVVLRAHIAVDSCLANHLQSGAWAGASIGYLLVDLLMGNVEQQPYN